MKAAETPDQPAAKPRLEALDSFRGISALMVVLYHSSFPGFIHDLSVVRNAYLFVDFFFVLSGFIMFYNYKNLQGIGEFRRFIGLRFFRLYPLHLATLLAVLCWQDLYSLARSAADWTLFGSDGAVALLLNITLTNGFGIRPSSFNVPSWSISTEFWTYLIFGLTVMLSRGRTRITIACVFTLVAAASLAILLGVVHLVNLGTMNFFRCTFGFFLGATLCAALAERPAFVPETRHPMIGNTVQMLLILGAVLMISYGGKTAWDFSIPFIFSAIIASIIVWPRTRLTTIAQSRIAMWLGRHSYSLYMVHWLVYIAINTLLRTVGHVSQTKGQFVMGSTAGFLLLALSVTLTLALASVTFRYIEEPGRLLGRRIFSAAPRSSA